MARPLIGIVSRLTRQKGADLLARAGQWIPAEDVYLVVLGEGDPEYEDFFRSLAEALPGRVAVRIGFDNERAHRILAGADMFLMPSRYEPCGMTQMFGLKYGTVPVVRSTGGLDDTIEEGTGFKFLEYSGAALLEAVRDAAGMFSDSARWRETMLRGMAKDFSWKASAKAYAALYKRLLTGVNL
jgi:starch synthase